MNGYLLFCLIAFITVLSPGPGVVLTITNALRFGVKGALPGIFGIALSTFILAGMTATGLAVLLATSSVAFTVIKFVGAAYLIFLGIKLWRSPSLRLDQKRVENKSLRTRFLEGFFLQLTNPKAVFFFISVLPQFVHHSVNATAQFLLLITTYSVLVITIHFGYAWIAKSARYWFTSDQRGRYLNRIGGTLFISSGTGLAHSSR